MQKMKNFAQRMCITVCVLSAFGFMARWVQNTSIFNESTGLADKWAAQSIILVLLTLGALAGMLFEAYPLSRHDVGAYPPGDIRDDRAVYKTITAICALMLFSGGTMIILRAADEPYSQLQRILGLLALASGAGVYYTGRSGKKAADSALSCFCTITPVLFGCFWLIVSYKDHAANPVVWAYAVEIIAIACTTAALYFIAGFIFGRPRLMSTAAVCAAAAFFCFMALGDDRPIPYQLCFAAMGIYFVVTLYALISGIDPGRQRFTHVKPAKQ